MDSVKHNNDFGALPWAGPLDAAGNPAPLPSIYRSNRVKKKPPIKKPKKGY